MFGYAPRFMPNYVSFDASNRPWILANLPMDGAKPAALSSWSCYVDGNCDGSKRASRGFSRVLLQTLDDLGRWKAVDVGWAASVSVPGATSQRVDGGTFVDQSVTLAPDAQVYVAINLENSGGKLMHANIEAASPEWRFVSSFWAALQLASEMHMPVGLMYTPSTSALSLMTGAHDSWASTVVHTAAPGEMLFWSDAKSHAGGSSAAHVRRGPDGETELAYVVYGTTEPAPVEEVEAWRAWYNASNPRFARMAGGGSAMPGTANWVVQYNFSSRSLDGGGPIFAGITLSNTQADFDYHNAPSLAVDTRGFIHLMLGSHGKPLIYRRSRVPWSVVHGFEEAELVYSQCVAGSLYCGIETYPAWLIDHQEAIHVVARMTGHYRDRGDGDAPYMLHYMRRNATSGNWEDRGPLLVPFTKHYHVYCHKLTMDHLGALYLSYYFNDYGGVRVPNMLVSTDHGSTWSLATTADFYAGLHATGPHPPATPPATPPPMPPPWAPGGPELIFGEYFDVRADSVAGSFVSGRLNPRANKDVRARNLTSWAFVLATESKGGRFDLVNLRDSAGRLFGALRIAGGHAAAPPNTTHSLAVELHDTAADVLLAARRIEVHVVNETMLERMGPRVRALIASAAHMHGDEEPQGLALEEQLQHIEAHDGRLKGHTSLYGWSLEEKRTGSSVQSDWEDALKDLGGLGWAYKYQLGDPPSPTARRRVRSAILAALSALAEAVPLDVYDVYNATDFAALDNPFKHQLGEGFARKDSPIDHKRQTHQWDIADMIGLACVEIAEEAMGEALNGSAAAWAGIDGALRLMVPVFTLNPNRRAIDQTTGRWGSLVDAKSSNGLWSDANLGHRMYLWACIMYFLQDYNRPITYVPYWYDDFRFEAFAKQSGTVVPTPFSLVRSFPSATGAMADLFAILRGGFHRARRIRQSGFLPDGFISHHCDKGNDAALKAYGFEWLGRLVEVAELYRDTPWAAELDTEWFAMPATYLTYTYNRVCFKGHIDWSFAGRAYSGNSNYRFWKSGRCRRERTRRTDPPSPTAPLSHSDARCAPAPCRWSQTSSPC